MVHGFGIEWEGEDQVQVVKWSYGFMFMERGALEMRISFGSSLYCFCLKRHRTDA